MNDIKPVLRLLVSLPQFTYVIVATRLCFAVPHLFTGRKLPTVLTHSHSPRHLCGVEKDVKQTNVASRQRMNGLTSYYDLLRGSLLLFLKYSAMFNPSPPKTLKTYILSKIIQVLLLLFYLFFSIRWP